MITVIGNKPRYGYTSNPHTAVGYNSLEEAYSGLVNTDGSNTISVIYGTSSANLVNQNNGNATIPNGTTIHVIPTVVCSNDVQVTFNEDLSFKSDTSYLWSFRLILNPVDSWLVCQVDKQIDDNQNWENYFVINHPLEVRPKLNDSIIVPVLAEMDPNSISARYGVVTPNGKMTLGMSNTYSDLPSFVQMVAQSEQGRMIAYGSRVVSLTNKGSYNLLENITTSKFTSLYVTK